MQLKLEEKISDNIDQKVSSIVRPLQEEVAAVKAQMEDLKEQRDATSTSTSRPSYA